MAADEQRTQPQAAPPDGTARPDGAPAPPSPPGAPAPGGPAAESRPAPEPASAEDAADTTPGIGDDASTGELDADLRELAGKASDYLALAQRTQADFENFRKRMTRDVRAAEARGIGRLARELLPALDNLERALASVDASGEAEQHLAKGVRLVQSDLSSALARAGIEGFAAKGERFDPVHHEAVAQQPVEGAEPGTIVEVLQSGYRLNDAVLRPARVVVAG